GLDVWGKIVGVSRRLTVKDDFNYLASASPGWTPR
ncbi:DUF2612 domain-containing protein, partial [Shigella flexneri]|nr:DUF2612 domain-containing protein [Shigella flexneri]EHF0740432.1 DUF2612 domain-containing protein [Shigella flexneri]